MSCTCACTCARTRTHRQTQSGVSCRPLLLSSLNQIPGTGLNNLNENAPPPPFEVLFPLVHSSHEGLWHQVVTGSQSYKRATQRENVFLHNCSSGGKKKKKKNLQHQIKSKTLKQRKQRTEFVAGFIPKATSHLPTAKFPISIIRNQWLLRLSGASCAAGTRPSQPTAKVKRRGHFLK